MEYLNERVHHNKFGNGEIIEVDEAAKHIKVKFSSGNEKKFIYPACFKTYLALLNSEAAMQAESDILKDQQEEERKKATMHYQAAVSSLVKQTKANTVKTEKSVAVHLCSNTEEFFALYKSALIHEIDYLHANGGKHQKIFDGKRVTEKNGRIIYIFEAEEELNLPDGTHITLWSPQGNGTGIIESCEEFTVVLSTRNNLGDDVPVLEFSAEHWRLMQNLIDRMDAMRQDTPELAKQLICDGYHNIDYSGAKLATGQDTAVQMSINQPITFVWGPPGTGKTQTLAKIALEHMRYGNRVLMLSYSNVSVDGAILRVHGLSQKEEPGQLVRYGYPRMNELLNHEYLTSYGLTIRNHPELLKERTELIAERKKVSHASPRYVEISKRLTDIRNKLSEEEKRAVCAAKFLATTVSKATADKTIYEQKYDVVIFDEASMAYIPQIVFSAGLAIKHFICMGDFRQLPPIVQSGANSQLNGDIFQYCGITKAIDSGKNHKWMCLLDTQYRMHPRIADVAGAFMYNNLLKSAPQMEVRRDTIVNAAPMSKSPIGWVDLSGMMSVCTKTAENSRVNPLSAVVAFSYALQAAKTMDVGIITPYHAQSRLLHAMARDAELSSSYLHSISCATVHQFQGSEKDAIIYDAVDCYRMSYPGSLLISTTNNYANRLFNVALTRARGKFICVANNAYMENKNLSKNLLFGHLMHHMKNSTSRNTGKEILDSCRFVDKSVMTSYNEMDGILAFLKDIHEAKKEIRIDIPNAPAIHNAIEKMAEALKDAKGKGVSVYVRAENKKDLPDVLKPLAIENKYVANPITVIDKQISWFGMPHSKANFVSEGSVIETRYRPTIRFTGPHTALSLYGFMEMSKTTDQSKYAETTSAGDLITDNFSNYILAKVKCPLCHEPMKVQKSKKGKFYLACTGYPACNSTALIEPELVNEYFYRKNNKGQRCTKCNCSLEAKLGPYGLYIQCCGLAKHKYKLDEI